MSVETLESIKQKAEVLTTKEKHILVESLIESIKNDMKADVDKSFLTNGSDESERQKQIEWIKANREKYGGQYVALDGDKLLGTGKNYGEAYETARSAGVEDAFVDFIPPKDYVGEMGGW